eukprot:g2058.t1
MNTACVSMVKRRNKKKQKKKNRALEEESNVVDNSADGQGAEEEKKRILLNTTNSSKKKKKKKKKTTLTISTAAPPSKKSLNWKLIALFCTIGAFFLSYTAVKPFLNTGKSNLLYHLSFHEQQALSYFDREDWKETIKQYEAALKENKKLHAMSWNTMGISLQKMGKTDESIACFRKSVQNAEDAHPFRSMINLANVLGDGSGIDEAIRIYDEIVKAHKSCIRLWSTDNAESAKISNMGQQTDADDVENGLGKFCDVLKEKNGEYAAFKEIVIDAATKSGALQIKNETYDGALKILKEALKIDKDHAKTHFLLGQLYLSIQDVASAADHLNRCASGGGGRNQKEAVKFRAVCSGILQKMKAIERTKKDKEPNKGA